MECPFCAEEVKDEALVCKHCSRDLKIPKPLIEENQELIATISELQLEMNRLKAELAGAGRRAHSGRRISPSTSSRRSCCCSLPTFC
jgi:hypothetical protein